MAVCRGAEGAAWLATRGADDTNGPAAPARALYLEGFALYLAKSDARCADVDENAPADARRRARALVVAAATSDAARDAWRRVVRDIDGGATRRADDAALRAAAARGDGEEVAALLEGGRARVDAADEYGRTALFLAAAAGQNVERLLAAGADPTRQAHGGWKPSHFIPREPLPLLGPTPPAWRLMIARDPPAPTATTRPLRGLAHPGAGSVVVDGAASADEVAAFLELARTRVEIELQAPTPSSLTHCLISTQARTLPVAPAEKAACADRSYFYDADGAFGRRFAGVAAAAWGVSVTRIRVNKCYRVLTYARAGGCLPAHVDLHRDLGDGGPPTTHTFLLYLTDDPEGGSTSLLSALPGDDALALSGGLVDGARTTLYAVHPKAGRLFLMPNACPHEAAAVVRAPKVLIRGELRLR